MVMNDNLIYLASPYSKYSEGRAKAFIKACQKAASLMGQGYKIFCPIAHSHCIEIHGMLDIKNGEFWLKQDFAVLKHCDELWVYKMEGWEESVGVKAEIEFASAAGIPIKYID